MNGIFEFFGKDILPCTYYEERYIRNTQLDNYDRNGEVNNSLVFKLFREVINDCINFLRF